MRIISNFVLLDLPSHCQVKDQEHRMSFLSEIVVNSVFDIMADSLAEGEPIEVRGFGSFNAAEHEAYEGRKFRIVELVFKSEPRSCHFIERVTKFMIGRTEQVT